MVANLKLFVATPLEREKLKTFSMVLIQDLSVALRGVSFTGSSNWVHKAAVNKPLKQKQVSFQNGGSDNFNRANLVFLSRSIDISTTKMSYNVNNPAFYELKDVYINTIIFAKE